MNYEAFPGPSQMSEISMDLKSEESGPERKMALKDLMKFVGVPVNNKHVITLPQVPVLSTLPRNVMEELGISMQPPSFNNIRVKEERMITSSLVPVLSRLRTNVKEERVITSSLVPVVSTLPTNVKEESVITSSLVPVLSTLPTNVDEDSGTSKPPSDCSSIEVDEDSGTSTLPPYRNSIEVKDEPVITTPLVPVLPTLATNGNAEPQHSTTKQPDASYSIKCTSNSHPPLRPLETSKDNNTAQQRQCIDSVQLEPHMEQSQTNSESNTPQEPQCLGPFKESSSIKCPKCPVILTNDDELLHHRCISKYIIWESMKKRPKCCFCENEYCDKRGLKKHIKTHVRKKYVKCSVCAKCLADESAFKVHALTHTNRWPYHCKICGKGEARKDILQIHETIHTKEKSWMCDVCGAMFINTRGLNQHRKSHSEKKHQCDICFRMFNQRSHLKRHKKIHGVREKFQCGDCESAFSSKWQLKCHIEIKHDVNFVGESFICPVCNKEFKHRYVFNKHMKKHKIRNENVYTCDMCKRNFASKPSLARHIAEHSGKQFSCSQCGMLFTQHGSVKRHMLKLHASDK